MRPEALAGTGAGRCRARSRTVLTLAGLLALYPGPAAPAAPVAGRTDPAPITGVARLYGCQPDPAGFAVRAIPLTARGEGAPDGSREGGPVFLGPFQPTPDPHVFLFQVLDARPGAGYRLTVDRPAGGCGGRIAWQGPLAGIVTAPAHVELTGLASQATLEVFRPGGPAGDTLVSADTLDLSSAAAMQRTFRYATTIPIGSARLQVALRRFPAGPESDPGCGGPPGLVHQQTFSLGPGGTAQVTVDFGSIIEQAPEEDLLLAGRGPVARAEPPVTAHQARVRAVLGAPFYVRVLPLDPGGNPRCDTIQDGVPVWVLLAHLKPPEPAPPPPDLFTLDTLNRYFPPVRVFADDGDPPHLGQYAVRVIQPYYLDPLGYESFTGTCVLDSIACQIERYVKGIDRGDTLQPGDRFWIKPASGGGGIPVVSDLVEGWGSIFSEALDGLGFLVNEASELWESIQDQVVKYAADAISLTGYDCDATCVAAVEFALETGLASAGIPPSLPNWDQLADMGTDYLVAQVAAELPPIPGKEEALKAAANEIVDRLKESIAVNRGDDDHPWLVPDVGVDPAVVLFDLVHVGPPVNDAFTPNLLVVRPNDLFLGASAAIPPYAGWPGAPGGLQSVVVPVVLRANTEGLEPTVSPLTPWSKEELAILKKDLWLKAFRDRGCVTLEIVAQAVTLPGPSNPGLILAQQPLMTLALLPQHERVFSLSDLSICLP